MVVKRVGGRRLFFMSGAFGTGLFLFSGFLLSVSPSPISSHLKSLTANTYLLLALISFVLSLVFPLIANKIIKEADRECERKFDDYDLGNSICLFDPTPVAITKLYTQSSYWVIRRYGDRLENHLTPAPGGAKQVCVTLTTGKVYVGFSFETPDPSDKNESFTILPVASGRRNKEHEMKLTTAYESALKGLEHIEADESDEISEEKIQEALGVITISVDKLVTVKDFSWDVWKSFQKNNKIPERYNNS